MQASLKAFDADGNSKLDRDEFVEFARGLVKNGPDVFFSRIGKDALVKTAILPILATSVQGGAGALGFQRVAQLPLHVTAPFVSVVFGLFRAILPIGLWP